MSFISFSDHQRPPQASATPLTPADRPDLLASASEAVISAAAPPALPGVALRPYQQKMMENLGLLRQGGARAPVVVAPTGSGKTHMFCALLVAAVTAGQRVLVVVPSRALLTQTIAAIERLGVELDVYAPGFTRPTGRLACVGTVQTLARRLDTLPPFDLLLVDEARAMRGIG